MCSNKYDSFSRTHCSPHSSHRLHTCHCSWIFHHVQTANRFVPAKQAGTDCPGESAVEARRTGPRHGRPKNIYNVETAKSKPKLWSGFEQGDRFSRKEMKVVDGDFLAENRSCAESVLLSLFVEIAATQRHRDCCCCYLDWQFVSHFLILWKQEKPCKSCVYMDNFKMSCAVTLH